MGSAADQPVKYNHTKSHLIDLLLGFAWQDVARLSGRTEIQGEDIDPHLQFALLNAREQRAVQRSRLKVLLD